LAEFVSFANNPFANNPFGHKGFGSHTSILTPFLLSNRFSDSGGPLRFSKTGMMIWFA
jgi:hypothetical protein